MKTILQVYSADGSPLCGHIIYAPDQVSMAQSIAQVTSGYVGCTIKEVATEAEIIIAPSKPIVLPM